MVNHPGLELPALSENETKIVGPRIGSILFISLQFAVAVKPIHQRITEYMVAGSSS